MSKWETEIQFPRCMATSFSWQAFCPLSAKLVPFHTESSVSRPHLSPVPEEFRSTATVRLFPFLYNLSWDCTQLCIRFPGKFFCSPLRLGRSTFLYTWLQAHFLSTNRSINFSDVLSTERTNGTTPPPFVCLFVCFFFVVFCLFVFFKEVAKDRCVTSFQGPTHSETVFTYSQQLAHINFR